MTENVFTEGCLLWIVLIHLKKEKGSETLSGVI
jgi:hypothetical protein